ncbi:MAG: hypothetical protein V4727_10175 [Verrucomicrobiota bacterium]
MASEESEDKRYWMQQAAKLSRRINLAWFLDGFAGPLLIAAVIGSVLVLGVRREFPDLHPAILGGSLAAVFLILGLIVLKRAWKRFESPAQALVRIEATQQMNSALSAASAGILPWPTRPKNLSESLNWHLPKTLTPPAAALILLAIGLLIPIKAKSLDDSQTSREPQAWSQLESQLEKLTEDAMVDETYLEDMKERLDQLRAQEEEQWFSHASLEATDSLKESHNSSLEDLQQDLSEAAEAMQELTDAAKDLNSEQKQKMAEQFDDALQGLQNGAMKPNQQLLDQLSQLDPKDMGNLNPEQMQQLKENMEKLKEALKEAGQGEGQGDDWADQLLSDGGEGQEGQNGEGKCPGDGTCPHGEDCQGECQGEGPGKGGIQRGPGHDPNVLKNPKDPLAVGDLTPVEAKDLSRALPGDLLQLQDGKHSVDQKTTPLSSGGQATKGAGGDRVWKESLNPEEQRALKNYFE